LASLALASLLSDDKILAGEPASFANPLAPKPPHFPAKAKSVIYLSMAGGPSQLELFDDKPKLQELNGQPIPESYLKNKRFAFMDSFTKQVPQLLGSKRKFARYGKCGSSISECLPHIAQIVDNIAVVRSVSPDVFNHAPAKVFMNTGSLQFGRPSMG